MTTIVDPAGTPSPLYNRSGVTIASINAAGEFGGPGSATAITSYSETTVVLVTAPDSNNFGVVLPSSAEVGDVVEIYYVSGPVAQIVIWAPSGDTVNGSSFVQIVNGIYRKVSSTAWRGVGA